MTKNVKKNVDRTSTNYAAIQRPSPTRYICTLHISAVISFMDEIKFPFFIEKNYKHAEAVEETINHTRCLGLGHKGVKRRRPKTKVFIFTFVCRGTSDCRASPCGPTSKRRNCGHGVRLFATNERPDLVIVEEFGFHGEADVDDDDSGYQLVPSKANERRKMTVSTELQALRSFARGLTPAKHLAHAVEFCTLNVDSTVPSLHDIRNAYRRFKRITHCSSDLDGVRNIISTFMEDEKFFISFENLENYSSEEALVILLAVRSIPRVLHQAGSYVLGLDATWGVTCYGFALFAIMGRTSAGALPLAYFISSSKGSIAIASGLRMFKKFMNNMLFDLQSEELGEETTLQTFTSYSPLAWCIDKDDAEHAALQMIFPSSSIILCHYHAMVIFIDEARAERHNLSSTEVTMLMDLLRELCSCTTVSNLKDVLQKIASLSLTFYEYLSKNFLNERWVDTFCEINRQHLPLSVIRLCRSNMLVEVSFKTLKYVILGGLHNKRLDDLIYTVMYRVFPYFTARVNDREHYCPRFHISKSSNEEGTLLYRLLQLYQLNTLEKGFDFSKRFTKLNENNCRYGHVSYSGASRYIVLSSDGQRIYNVHIEMEGNCWESTCSCKAFAFNKNACKHIVAVRITKNIQKPMLEEDRPELQYAKVIH